MKFYHCHVNGSIDVIDDTQVTLTRQLSAGPASIAYELLLDAFSDSQKALRLAKRVDRLLVSRIPKGRDWLITENDVRRLAALCEGEERIA